MVLQGFVLALAGYRVAVQWPSVGHWIKIGPICRSVEDTAIVLHAINGFDATDAGSIDLPFGFNGSADVKGARLGYDPAWFEKASEHDRDALEKTKAAGLSWWKSSCRNCRMGL